MPLESRRRWGTQYLRNIRDAIMLVQGTGTGWDVISWARLRPRKIIATDMFPFEDSWGEIASLFGDGVVCPKSAEKMIFQKILCYPIPYESVALNMRVVLEVILVGRGSCLDFLTVPLRL
jgi:hypothetical protein